MFQTEYEFRLPKGYVDDDGNLHREAIMRLATASDEILPQKDPRVQQNPAYLIIILLSRTITRLGALNNDEISPAIIEKLFASDLRFLEEFYNKINNHCNSDLKVQCPVCGDYFKLKIYPD